MTPLKAVLIWMALTIYSLVLFWAGEQTALFAEASTVQSAAERILAKPPVIPRELIARWQLRPTKEGGIPLLGEDGHIYALDDWARAVNSELADRR